MMMPQEFIDKIELFDRKESLEPFCGVGNAYRLIKGLSWWNNLFLYHWIRQTDGKWIDVVYEMFLAFELMASPMGPFRKAYYAVLYHGAYSFAARRIKSKSV